MIGIIGGLPGGTDVSCEDETDATALVAPYLNAETNNGRHVAKSIFGDSIPWLLSHSHFSACANGGIDICRLCRDSVALTSWDGLGRRCSEAFACLQRADP